MQLVNKVVGAAVMYAMNVLLSVEDLRMAVTNSKRVRASCTNWKSFSSRTESFELSDLSSPLILMSCMRLLIVSSNPPTMAGGNKYLTGEASRRRALAWFSASRNSSDCVTCSPEGVRACVREGGVLNFRCVESVKMHR